MQDLISFVQSHPRKKKEDLAGEVLAMLLREDAGQQVLRNLLNLPRCKRDSIDVVTQRMISGCIPDIHVSLNGEIIGVIELKFWADLTEHQSSGRYSTVAERIIFVVPEERKQKGSAGPAGGAEVLTWRELLGSLDEAVPHNETREERLFHAALEHLTEFCNVVEKERFVPFTSSQLLKPVPDSPSRHLVWLTDEFLSAAIGTELIKEAKRLRAGFDTFFYYGQTVRFGKLRAWVGYWPQAWTRWPEMGPIWVQFYGANAARLRLTGAFKDGKVTDNDLSFPLFKADGPLATQEDEVMAIVKNLTQLKGRLGESSLLKD